MRWIRKPKIRINPQTWHWWFAWWPTRVQTDTIVWLEFVSRRYVVDDHGTWAGGYVYHWEYYLNEVNSTEWAAPKVYD